MSPCLIGRQPPPIGTRSVSAGLRLTQLILNSDDRSAIRFEFHAIRPVSS
jgi:hypothetical protein